MVLSLRKLKTRDKAGMTGTLENFTGLSGNTGYLPHHRAGGASDGVGCDPGSSLRKALTERPEDGANHRLGQPGYPTWPGPARAARLVAAGRGGRMDGASNGNDSV